MIQFTKAAHVSHTGYNLAFMIELLQYLGSSDHPVLLKHVGNWAHVHVQIVWTQLKRRLHCGSRQESLLSTKLQSQGGFMNRRVSYNRKAGRNRHNID